MALADAVTLRPISDLIDALPRLDPQVLYMSGILDGLRTLAEIFVVFRPFDSTRCAPIKDVLRKSTIPA